MTNLPVPLNPLPNNTEQRLVLVRKMQEAKQNLDHTWNDLKRDSITTVVGIVSAYIGYKVVRWLFVPSKQEKREKQTPAREIHYVEMPTPKNSNNSNSWVNMLLSRAGSILVDIVLEKVQDNFPITFKKDKKKEKDEHSA